MSQPTPADLPANLAWQLLASAGEAVAVKDERLRYVWVNSAFCGLFDLDEADVIGKVDDEVFLDGPRMPDPAAERKVLTTGKSAENYETIFLPDGTLRELLTSMGSTVVQHRSWLMLVFHDITEVITANHSLVETTEALAAVSVELRAQAMLDPLTGLLNRRGFQELAPKAYAANRHSGGFLMLDLDDFKRTNDCHGHEIGDSVLMSISDTIRSTTRLQTDIVARLGGDEFVVAMPGSSRKEVETVAERIRAEAERFNLDLEDADRGNVPVTITIGAVYRSPGPMIGLDEWRQAADELLYRAKEAGRNRVAVGAMTEPTSDD